MTIVSLGTNEKAETAIKFLRTLFIHTEQPIFLQTLANDPRDPDEARNKKQLLTRDIEQITRFIHSHDRARRGLFFCVGTLATGSPTRNKDNVSECIGLHADLDFKAIGEDEPTIWVKLDSLPCLPTVIVRSGGGLHCYWLFKEALDAQEYRGYIEAVLRKLADIVAGDIAVCEIARLMRLPGTHNSKRGDMREVVIERLDGPRYDLEDLEDWMVDQLPVLTRKPVKAAEGAPEANTNPYLQYAQQHGYKPRLDVSAALAEMAEGNIHNTLLRVSASLITAGQPTEEVVEILMEASRLKGGPDWDWRVQEREIRHMCASAQTKFVPIVSRETGSSDAVMISLDEARERKGKAKPRPRQPSALIAPFVVADGVIETIRRRGMDIMLAEGEVWMYGDGFWRIMTPEDRQWMSTEIQTGFETLGEPGKTAALFSCWKRINEHPRLYKAKVPWAEDGMIVCSNGMLNTDTWQFEPHAPANYARRHIGTEYVHDATCPQFHRLLESMFADRADAPVAISLVQEWAGAALAIGTMAREERRALILVGPSRTGKTELAKVFSLLFGEPLAASSVSEISERFGLSGLYQAVAWVRDDAINEGDKLDPQRFKTIVTGERVSVEIKNKQAVTACLNIPVLLTANTLPRARDGSDAIFNRSIILTMTNVIEEQEAYQARVAHGGHRGLSIGAAVFGQEGPGILNWALTGLRRLRERGFYDLPASVADAIRQFKDDNNPVGEWSREAVEADKWSKVERRDLVRAYNGWELELEGDEARAHGGRWLLPRLRARVKGLGDMQTNSGARYITGIRLTRVGLNLWDSYGKASPRNGAGGFAVVTTDVNKPHDPGLQHTQQKGNSDAPF